MNRLMAVAVAALLMLSCASGANDAEKTDKDANKPRYTAEPGSTPVGVIPAGTLRDVKRNAIEPGTV